VLFDERAQLGAAVEGRPSDAGLLGDGVEGDLGPGGEELGACVLDPALELVLIRLVRRHRVVIKPTSGN
jgi:hypothetical protein